MSPFELAQAIGQNVFGARQQIRDNSAISEILNQYQESTLGGQDSAAASAAAMNQILSRVSPQRQPGVFGALNLQEQQQQRLREQEARNLASRAYQGEKLTPQEFSRLPLSVQKELSQTKAPPGGVTAQPIPPEVQSTMASVIQNNPDLSSDQLAIKLDQAGVPRIYSNLFVENRRRAEEASQLRLGREVETKRKETLPVKQNIVNKAQDARETLRNKAELESIIETGNLDDPTFAIFATSLPFNLGQRLLSDETVSYRAAMIDEFKDLRNIFKGQTRVAELDILQKKLPDIYLTDSQKKAVLKSRLNTLNADIIREEVAAEIEDKFPNLGLLKFQRKVEELAQPRIKELLDGVIDTHQRIFNEAERQKETPLDPNDPEDRQILTQLLKEAKGNKKEARKLATKKGYKF